MSDQLTPGRIYLRAEVENATSDTPPPYGAPAAAAKELLTPERLASIRAQSDEPRSRNPFVTDYGVAADVVEELLDHIDAAAAGHHAREASLKSELDGAAKDVAKLELVKELKGQKARVAFVAVANGLAEALNDDDWDRTGWMGVYRVWENITKAMAQNNPAVLEELTHVPGPDSDDDY